MDKAESKRQIPINLARHAIIRMHILTEKPASSLEFEKSLFNPMSSKVADHIGKGLESPPRELDREKGLSEQSLEDAQAKAEHPEVTFPDGGFRAWSVAVGCSLIMFSTFGYVNAYG